MGSVQSFEKLERVLNDFSGDKAKAIEDLTEEYSPLLEQLDVEEMRSMIRDYDRNYEILPITSAGAGGFAASIIYSLIPPSDGKLLLGLPLLSLIPISVAAGYALKRRARKKIEREFVSRFGEDVYKDRFNGSFDNIVSFYSSGVLAELYGNL